MAKEKEKIELKPVDEEAEKVRRVLRLHPEAVEEVEESPPLRLGEPRSPARVEPASVRTKALRTNEPDIGSLIEREEPRHEAQWDAAPAAAKRLPWGWAALVGCLFGGGILWSLWSVNRSDKKQELLVGESVKMIESEQEEEAAAEKLVTAIEAGVRSFFGSESVGEMLRFVRHPERIAILMEDHYGESPPMPGELKNFRGMTPVTIDNSAAFWIASCELLNGEIVEVLVEAKGDDEAKVDWETYVNYQPMPWDEFARRRPGGYTGDFRVYVEPDNFYSHEFSDSGTFSSFRLTALRGEEALTGYAPRGEALEEEIMDIIARNGGGPTPMILRLHVPKDLRSKRGLVVVELVCPRWVYIENPEKADS